MRIVQHFLAVAAALFAALAAAVVLGVGPTAADPVGTPASLHGAHIGATNPGFTTGSCPSSASGSWAWHFVLPGDDTTFVSINAVFLHEGAVTSFISHPTGKHAYVYTHQADTLLGATAMVDGSQTWFNLSHVCTGVDETPPSTTAPSTTVPYSTTAPSTTVSISTTRAATTTEAPTTTSAPTTVSEQSDPSVTVLGVVETAAPVAAPTQLAFTGSHTVFMLLLGAGLMSVGSILTAASRRRVLLPPRS